MAKINEVLEVAVDELRPYEKNAKIHGKEQIELIARSIQEFGFISPIIIDENKNIIAGHGRLEASRLLNMQKVPCLYVEGLTEEQRKAYILADNRLGEIADWDMALVNAELIELQDVNFDISLTGFELEIEEEPDEVVEDVFNDEPAEEARAKVGDIYQLGRHRLMCGDSTSVDNLEALFDGEKIDLVLTDPPYGVNIVKRNKVGTDAPFGSKGTEGFGKKGNNKILDCNTYIPIKGDETTETARAFYNSCIAEGIENYILFGGNYFTDFLTPQACWLVWDKENTGNFADVELAWTSFDKGAKLYKWLWNGLCRKGDRKTEGVKRVHPTQKPVGMLAEILKDFSEEGQNIFDGFGGSGSTLIACEQTARNCFMIEYEPLYIDIIIDRWEKFTGQKAVLLNEKADAK